MSEGTQRRLISQALLAGAIAASLALAGTAASAQQPAGQPGGQPGGQQGRAGGAPPAPRILPYVASDSTGFVSIFDGTLKNWDGDPRFWRAEGDEIIGESSAQNVVNPNTFLVFRGDRPRDFELKLDFKMNSTNSGVQIRSKEMPAVGKWVLSGYQADFDFANGYTGQWYEERGRGFLAERGMATYIPAAGQKPQIIGTLGSPLEMKGLMNVNGWNNLHIIARGNTLIQILNGRVSAIVVDDDPAGRAMEGLIGLQMHMGPPMKVEYRNIRLKKL